MLFADSFSDAKEKGKRGQLQHLNFGISKDPGIAYVTMMSPFLEAELQKIKATKIEDWKISNEIDDPHLHILTFGTKFKSFSDIL